MAVKYEFTISTDFPNARVDSTRLDQEIRDSAITVALAYITTSEDVCAVWFRAELGGADQGVLAAVVAAHSGDPLAALVEPQDVDGRKFTAPNLFPLGVLTNFCGALDNVETGEVGSEGLCILSNEMGTTTKVMQFVQWSYLAGGHIFFRGMEIGDWVGLDVYCPATVGVEHPGGGNYNKVAVGGGASIFVPTAPGAGQWDLDLTARENANVGFAKVRPVPAPSRTGCFDWSEDEVVTVNPLGQGSYHLFDVDVPLSQFLTRAMLLGDDHLPLIVPAVKPIRMLAQWRFVISMYNTRAKTQMLTAILYRAKPNVL
jgi:hypothetical protein